jgi:hypothetical protein
LILNDTPFFLNKKAARPGEIETRRLIDLMECKALFLYNHLHETGIDILTSGGLMTMNRYYIPAGLEGLYRRLAKRISRIGPCKTSQFSRRDPIQIDLGILIVMNPQLQVRRNFL